MKKKYSASQSAYYEKLKDPRWQKKRLEILERDGWMCRSCGDKTNTLHIHHIFYLPQTEPWEINNGFLITLCERCHKPGPCDGKPRCADCEDFLVDGGCEGFFDPRKDIVDLSGELLDLVWSVAPDTDILGMVQNIQLMLSLPPVRENG